MSHEQLDLSFTPTASEYTAWVDSHGRSPTQDPIYNHTEDPSARVSVDQETKHLFDSLPLDMALEREAAQKVIELKQAQKAKTIQD